MLISHTDPEKINDLIKQLKSIHSTDPKLKELISSLKAIKSDEGMDSLSNTASTSRKLLQYTGKLAEMKTYSESSKIDETIEMLQNVMDNKKWENPYMEVNLLLEWAIYRAFSSLNSKIPDEYGPILNSDGTEPIFTAGGNRPDLVAEFDNYVIVVESTITNGSRQYNTETEPVTRHVAHIQKSYPEKKVYSFFIARDIDSNVVEYFLVYHAFHKHPESNNHLLLVPISIKDFKELYKKLSTDITNAAVSLKRFFENVEHSRNANNCEQCRTSQMDVRSFTDLITKELNYILKK